jgi:hypothetical protein
MCIEGARGRETRFNRTNSTTDRFHSFYGAQLSLGRRDQKESWHQ